MPESDKSRFGKPPGNDTNSVYQKKRKGQENRQTSIDPAILPNNIFPRSAKVNKDTTHTAHSLERDTKIGGL
jgi:hypothetical protein